MTIQRRHRVKHNDNSKKGRFHGSHRGRWMIWCDTNLMFITNMHQKAGIWVWFFKGIWGPAIPYVHVQLHVHVYVNVHVTAIKLWHKQFSV